MVIPTISGPTISDLPGVRGGDREARSGYDTIYSCWTYAIPHPLSMLPLTHPALSHHSILSLFPSLPLSLSPSFLPSPFLPLTHSCPLSLSPFLPLTHSCPLSSFLALLRKSLWERRDTWKRVDGSELSCQANHSKYGCLVRASNLASRRHFCPAVTQLLLSTGNYERHLKYGCSIEISSLLSLSTGNHERHT